MDMNKPVTEPVRIPTNLTTYQTRLIELNAKPIDTWYSPSGTMEVFYAYKTDDAPHGQSWGFCIAGRFGINQTWGSKFFQDRQSMYGDPEDHMTYGRKLWEGYKNRQRFYYAHRMMMTLETWLAQERNHLKLTVGAKAKKGHKAFNKFVPDVFVLTAETCDLLNREDKLWEHWNGNTAPDVETVIIPIPEGENFAQIYPKLKQAFVDAWGNDQLAETKMYVNRRMLDPLFALRKYEGEVILDEMVEGHGWKYLYTVKYVPENGWYTIAKGQGAPITVATSDEAYHYMETIAPLWKWRVQMRFNDESTFLVPLERETV